jgi:hypothetical protein
MLRRKRLRDELVAPHEAFVRVLHLVEEAKIAITSAVPTTRFAGRPLAEALAEYEDAIARAAQLMPGWRVPELEDAWGRCDAGLRRALEVSEELRIEAPDPGGFEGLVGSAGELIGALDEFGPAEEAFKALRTS